MSKETDDANPDPYKEARAEIVARFRQLIEENDGLTRYEAACFLSATYPRTDAKGRPSVRFEETAEELDRIEQHIEQAYSHPKPNQLRPVNPKAPPPEWRYDAADLIAWADKTDVGDTTLAREVVAADTIESAAARRNKRHRQADRHSSNREQALGAAVAVLVAYPELCRDKRGRVTAQNIAETIEQRSYRLFEGKEAPLKVKTMAGYINEWLNKVRNGQESTQAE